MMPSVLLPSFTSLSQMVVVVPPVVAAKQAPPSSVCSSSVLTIVRSPGRSITMMITITITTTFGRTLTDFGTAPCGMNAWACALASATPPFEALTPFASGDVCTTE